MIRHFDRPPYLVDPIDNKKVATPLPTIASFSAWIGCSVKTVRDWIDKYPEFASAFEVAMAFQEIAANATKVGNLNISPELLQTLLQAQNGQDDVGR